MPTTFDIMSGPEREYWVQNSQKSLEKVERSLVSKYLTDKESRIIEAGTGGGRIAFNLEAIGFQNIDAFDFVPQMIDEANKFALQRSSNVHFHVADATSLAEFESNSYDYALYLQQILSGVPINLVERALEECHRVLKGNGLALFSFMDYDSRKYNKVLDIALNVARLFRGEQTSRQILPRLKIDHKWNYKFLSKGQAIMYWFRRDEIVQLLEKAGFEIIEVKIKHENNGIYIACRKIKR